MRQDLRDRSKPLAGGRSRATRDGLLADEPRMRTEIRSARADPAASPGSRRLSGGLVLGVVGQQIEPAELLMRHLERAPLISQSRSTTSSGSPSGSSQIAVNWPSPRT